MSSSGSPATPPIVTDEERLSALRRYDVLDTPRERAFDDLTRLTARFCDAPIAIVSFVDRDRQWFKAEVGLGTRQTPLDVSVCAHALSSGDDLFVVPDIAADPRFADSRLVTGPPHLRFYAGAVLRDPAGHGLGTLAVLDTRPRGLSAEQADFLRAVAAQVMTQLELRRAVAELRTTEIELRATEAGLRAGEAHVRESEARFRQLADAMPQIVFAADAGGNVDYFNRRWYEYTGFPEDSSTGQELWATAHDPAHLPRVLAAWTAAVRAGDPYESEYPLRRHDGAWRWHLARALPIRDAAGAVVRWYGTNTDIHDQRRAADALARSREQMELVVRGANVGVWYCPLPFDRLIWDEAVKEHFHLPPDADVTIDTFYERIHPDDRAATRAAIEASIAGRTPYDIDYRTVSADGSRTKWVRAIGRGFYDRSGNPTRFDGITIDVTDRALTAAALREGEERYRLATRATNNGIWDWDLRTDAVRWNVALNDLFGYPPDQIDPTARWWVDHIHPDDRDRVTDGIHAVIDDPARDHWEAEYRFRRLDGSWAEVFDRGYVLRDAAGRGVRMLGAMQDRTLQKTLEREREATLAAERRARAESDTLRAEAETLTNVGRMLSGELALDRFVQAATDAATAITGAAFGSFFYNVTDDKGESYALYSISGVPRAAFERFPMPRNTDVFGPTFRNEGIVLLDDVTADPRYGRNAPYHGMPPGHLPVRSYLAVPVVSRAGEVIGGMFFGHPEAGRFTERHGRLVVGIAAQAAIGIDNARLYESVRAGEARARQTADSERAARAEAERVGRMKDEFLATLSHELRTPLNAILGWSQIVRRSTADAATVDEGLATIERNARTQAQIIEDLLDMSRIISGKVRLDVQRVDLAEVVRASVDTCRPAADAKSIRIQAVLDPHAGPVSGDPNRLQQVFWNLISNAVKFTPKSGRVQVLLERVNSHLEVSIIDTGEGIRPEFLPHVFDRFRQADASTTRRHGGLGLGLAIVKHLAELHGGSVRVKSAGAGLGTTFTVALPLTVVHPDPAAADPGRRHPRGGDGVPWPPDDMCASIRGVRVLVVDDEPDARALVKRVLEDCEAVVATAGSAEEAVAALTAARPDVLVSDIGMPGEDGYSLIKRVRALGPTRGGDVPALALTAYARADDRMRAILAGFQMHVPKPVEPAELVTMVASLAGRTRA